MFHLLTVGKMDTRQLEKGTEQSNNDEEDKKKKKGTKKMQRYRSNVKADPVRLEEMFTLAIS